MVLEATMICVDNSEWMRNGDYSPSRFQAQSDAVNLISGAKTQANPENTVGILTMAGKGVRVLATPTSDLGKILACMHEVDLRHGILLVWSFIVMQRWWELGRSCYEIALTVREAYSLVSEGVKLFRFQFLKTAFVRIGLEMGGETNIAAAIQVAQLALKHRQNKHQQQRIIVFAGSPVKYDIKMLEMIGKKLKKNSVALDIVDFGEEDDGKPEKLEALLAAVNNNDSSHIVHIPSGANALSDVLISTPVFTGDGEGGSGFAAAAAAAAASVGASGFDFDVDPNIDPELALALRVSLEEERARQEAAAKRAAEEASRQEKGEEPSSNAEDATMAEQVNVTAPEENNKATGEMDDENALLEQALVVSMNTSGAGHSGGDAEMLEANSEDQELALALQMSMQESARDQSSQSVVSKVLEDQAFVSSILASLPGVDPNDPSVRDLIASMQSQSEAQQKKNEDEPPNEGK
ncbi:26S proteasome non-ATPase regulatory subunit 4 homolog [Fagus crenata]